MDSLSEKTISACHRRQDRLRAAMEAAEIDALLVGHDKDIRYLTSFVGDDSLLLISRGAGDAAVIITDARYDELLEPWRASGMAEIVIGTRHRLERSVKGLADRHGVKHLGVQAEHMTLAERRRLIEVWGGRTLVETHGLVGRLRRTKDEWEIAAIERGIAIQEEALTAALTRLSLGMTELEFCAALEYEMKTRGAAGPSFGTMVAGGPRSSIIHYETGAPPIEEGTLLIDWGAVVDGYCSDMTRTFGVGRLPDKVAEIYPIVLEAQQAAIDACKPGIPCAEIDAVARGIIKAAGYGEQFGHGLGHGLGLDIHEAPFFNELSTDVRLEPGMVMTVEPGIYLPGVGGVRIEDDILITESGCRVLTGYPKDPGAAVIEQVTAGHSAS